MPYRPFEFTIPKNTAALSPTRKTVDVLSPVILRISINIPAGHKGLASISVNSPGVTLMEGIKGDNQVKDSGPLQALLFGPPYYVTFEGYNLDTFLNHTFYIEIQTR